jgi:hypothetical protein
LPDLSPTELLQEAARVCAGCAHAGGYTVRHIDVDALSLRVSLTDGAFVEAFYNVATGKVSFALIDGRVRVYGKDNDYRSWHEHPYGSPEQHRPCPPSSFAAFLAEVESLRFSR